MSYIARLAGARDVPKSPVMSRDPRDTERWTFGIAIAVAVVVGGVTVAFFARSDPGIPWEISADEAERGNWEGIAIALAVAVAAFALSLWGLHTTRRAAVERSELHEQIVMAGREYDALSEKAQGLIAKSGERQPDGGRKAGHSGNQRRNRR